MAYGDFKVSNGTIAANKVLCDRAFNTAKYLKFDGYKRWRASMIYNFCDEKSLCGAIKKGIMQNKELLELAKKLHKTIIRQFQKGIVHSSFIDNIWGADLSLIQLISKFNKEFRFSLVLLIFIVNMHRLFL